MRVEQVTANKPPEAAVPRRQQQARPDSRQNAARETAPEPAPHAREPELRAAVERANRVLQQIHDRNFQFSIHEPTKEIIVRVIDAATNEVVKEIPPEQLLDLAAKLWELAGIFVDEKR